MRIDILPRLQLPGNDRFHLPRMTEHSYARNNHRGGAVVGLHLSAVRSLLSRTHQWPTSHQKLPSLTKLGYNVSTRLQEHRHKYNIGNTAGLTSMEHAFQSIESKKFATSWAEIRAGHIIPRLRDAGSRMDTNKSCPHSSLTNHESANRKQAEAPNDESADDSHDRSKTKPFTSPAHATAMDKWIHSMGSDSVLKRMPTKPSAGGSSSSSSYYVPAKAAGAATHQRPRRLAPLGHDSWPAAEPAALSATSCANQSTSSRGTSKRSPQLRTDMASTLKDFPTPLIAAQTDVPKKQLPVVPKREAQRYMRAKSVYLVRTDMDRQRRKHKFLRQLQDVAEKAAAMHNARVEQEKTRQKEAQEKQEHQLELVRTKFENERKQRLRTQHVAKNALGSNDHNRATYGLPENYSSRPTYSAKLRNRHSARIDKRDLETMQSRLTKRYSKLFNISLAPTFDPRAVSPNMEGYDTVEMTVFAKNGKQKKRQILVQDIVKDAVALIKTSDKNDKDDNDGTYGNGTRAGERALSKMSLDNIDDDEDDEDIFERLFKKYNLNIHEDEVTS